jgi:alpha-2-macroglobulin
MIHLVSPSGGASLYTYRCFGAVQLFSEKAMINQNTNKFTVFYVAILLCLMALPAFAQKTFVRDDLAQEVTRLEQRLRSVAGTTLAQPLPTLLRDAQAALNRNDARRALQLANSAVLANPNASEPWRLMARAALAVEARDYRERYDMSERATAAAYAAYSRAQNRGEEAAALALLGDVFARRENWRPALTTYRMSLDLEDKLEIRTTYEDLREKRGFRLVENKVDADSATPRACFIFSEPLARGRVDFSSFVAITGGKGDFAVTGENTQLCVEGLRHGERYGMVVRRGVPSSVPSESLTKSGDFDIYIRDRTPSVRFSGKSYVLPRTGQQGIPLTSVNTESAQVEVLRIGDRNLLSAVHSEDFMAQIGMSDVKRISDERGLKVWSGTLQIKSELNKDVITAFPVTEAVGELKPGVYVMVAKPNTQASSPSTENDDDSENGRSSSQWFVVSDIGLTSFSGPDGLHILARSLANAAVITGVELKLIAKNNEVLGTARTDASGHARFEAGLSRGQGGMAPGLVQAALGADHGFLDLKQTAFDLTDRGVKGRIAPAALDAFVFSERGVYRSGETVYITTLLRDHRGSAVAGVPLTIIVRRPDGVEHRRQVVEDQGAGGRAFSLPLLSGISPGTWRVQVHLDPRKDAVGETTFLVEDYVPEKLELELKAAKASLQAGEPAEINVVTKYLYGAAGAELSVGGEITLKLAAKSAIPGFDGYQVGLTTEDFSTVKNEIEDKVTTDAQGRAKLLAPVAEAETSRPVEAEFAIRVGEPGGRAITRTLTLPIVPKGTAVGVKKLFDDGSLGDGQTANFDVILAQGDGRRLERRGVKWTLSRINRNYQWFFLDGRWNYEAVKSTRRIADGVIDVETGQPARIASPVNWGTYRLEVVSGGTDSAETIIEFSVGYEADKTAETPDVLDVALDKQSYASGEVLKLRIASRFSGKATVTIMSDKVHDIRTVDLGSTGTSIDLPVKAEWGSSVYAVVLAHRPLDEMAKRMPGRAIGLVWFAVDKSSNSLDVKVETPRQMRPRQPLEIPVRVSGMTAGEEAFVTIAAVDVGILNLTRHQPPNPTEHYFGQRALGHELRDLYGYLIDGMQGTRGAIRSGGDAQAKGIEGDVPSQAPVAFYSGVVRVGADGLARVNFQIPAFNGTIRVMATAWSRNKTGQAHADVVSRDPVVTQVTLPRFLNVGDQSRLHLAVNNVEGQAGDYVIDLDVRGPVIIPAQVTRQTIRLAIGGKGQVSIPITAGGAGVASVDIRMTGPGSSSSPGIDVIQSHVLRIQAGGQTIARRVIRPLDANGGQITVSSDLAADMLPGTARIALSVSPLAALDVPGLLKALDRYPYGCTEQTISRALPLLYINRLAPMADLGLDGNADERVREAVERVLARQGANGSFGLWGVGGDDLWLDSFVADFLTRVRERNITVPQLAFSLALDRLRNQVVNTSEIRKEEAAGIAYATYVLARNGRPVMGDLRYLSDNKLSEFESPLARGQIAAGLALLGDRTRARTAFRNALSAAQIAQPNAQLSRADYGSRLRDNSGLLALLSETNGDQADIQTVSTLVERSRADADQTSTQEQMWMVLAAQAMNADPAALTLAINGNESRGAYYRGVSAESLEDAPITIANRGASAARAVLTISGTPITPEPALDQGFTIQRQIFTMKGETIDASKFRQNERYVIVLRISERIATYGRLLVVDPLPAGLEIENSNLTDGAALDGLPWLKDRNLVSDEDKPEHTQSRDDRFVAAFTRQTGQKSLAFGVAYIVRAVSPGRYVYPAAVTEDMYRPDRFGRTAFGLAEIAPAR